MQNYRRIINGIAFNVLTKPVEMPDYHLMVGTAENLSDVPLKIKQTKVPTKIVENLEKLETLSNDSIENAIANNMLEINDFNGNTAILAGMVGGVR